MNPWLPILWLLLAAFASAEERILSFHSRIQVLPSGDLEVTEILQVASEQNAIRHGIFRDFPRLYQGKWGLREERPFEVTAVTRDGKPEPFALEDHQAGTRVRIGSKGVLLDAGTHTYSLSYRTGRQLLFFPDHDELYWNVTGNEWAFPILAASAEVILPDGVTVTGIEGYLGPEGSKERPAPDGASTAGNRATLAAGRTLQPGEGFTVVATWPPRSLDAKAYENPKSRILRENPLLIAAAVLLVAMFAWHCFAWVAVGRDPAPGLVIPQFAPPDGWSPAAVRMLVRMGFDNTCFSAAVLGLAAKKHLTIAGSEKKPTLQRTNSPSAEPLAADETALLQALLGGRESIELAQANHKTISAARTALERSLRLAIEKTHFKANLRYWLPGFLLTVLAVILLMFAAPQTGAAAFMLVWLSIWSLGTGALVSAVVSQARSGRWLAAVPMSLFALPFVVGWCVGVFFFIHAAGQPAAAAFVIGVIVNTLFYHWIKAPTHLGRKRLDHIDGFRHYLSVAEEDRLSGFTCPQKTPELFEQFLPYAHALGVEQEWSERFAEVLKAAAAAGADGQSTYRPSFYSGSHRGFSGAMTAAALGGALTSALTSASSSPRSSGSSGGGSSGGGGGGGGGGGW